MTCENMWLAATSFGLACALNAMPLNDPRKRELIADVVGLPHSWDMLGAFSFGQPSEPRFVGPSRGPLEGAVYDEHWGNSYIRLAFREGPLELGETPKMDLFEAIKAQKQVMKFKEEKVPQWKIEKILDAGKWAPNPENLQHSRYVISRDQSLKQMLTDWNMELLNVVKSFKLLPEDMVKGMEPLMEFPLSADTVIVPCTTRSTWLEYPFGAGNMANYIFFGATGHSVQNMCLAAIGLGLGTTYDITAVTDNRRLEVLCDYLGIPRSWDPLGVLYVGVPESYTPSLGAPSLNELVFSEHWGNPYYE
jgi:nitroreductase